MDTEFNKGAYISRLTGILDRMADERGVIRCTSILEAIQVLNIFREELEKQEAAHRESEKQMVTEIEKLKSEIEEMREESQNGD